MLPAAAANRNTFPNSQRDRSYEAELAQESAERIWSLAQLAVTDADAIDALYCEAQTLRKRVGELVAENVNLRSQDPFR